MPAGGGTQSQDGLRLPGLGLGMEPLNAVGPLLTLAVAVEPRTPANFAAGDPTCVLFQRLLVNGDVQTTTARVQMTQTAAGQGSWCFQFPVPPECTVGVDVTAGATLSGNPEPVTIHMKAYVIAADATLQRYEVSNEEE